MSPAFPDDYSNWQETDLHELIDAELPKEPTDKNVGLLLVLDQDKLVGVVSERDCVRRAVLARKPLETTKIADVMAREVVTVPVD
ncbi:CBS domain-containing protein, partial [Lacticaseibacillus rhamnosus]